MDRLLPAIAAIFSASATIVWIRAATRQEKVVRRLSAQQIDLDLWRLAKNDFARDIQMVVFTGLATVAMIVVAFVSVGFWPAFVISMLAIPSAFTLFNKNSHTEVARIAEARADVEQKAREVLSQEELAPLQWAARLAPSNFPEMKGIEIGQAYQAGAGAMAGDFYDVFKVDKNRTAMVIGDVTGHGIEPSITALQAKYLLRAFLLQFRDPGQALEELNAQMVVLEGGEEFISLCVILFDSDANTLRYSSAGHPAAFVWNEREVKPLGATGPLLMLDPNGLYHSREISWQLDDIAVLYTDGLAEARKGEILFGEDGIAALIRRDPTVSPSVMTKLLVEAARDFAEGPIADDLAVLVVRRSE